MKKNSHDLKKAVDTRYLVLIRKDVCCICNKSLSIFTTLMPSDMSLSRGSDWWLQVFMILMRETMMCNVKVAVMIRDDGL